MAVERLIIKRNWNDPVIKVRIDATEIAVETSVAAFQQRVATLLLEQLPNLSWDFRTVSIHDKVRASFNNAFTAAVQEMKQETIKVVG